MGLFTTDSNSVRGEPREMLFRYASGQLPDWINGHDGPVGWVKYSHRGIQFMDRIHLGKEKRHIFSNKFDIRFNTAFEQVVRCCADLGREGKTWITEELIRGYVALHRLGFAWCCEAWQGGTLVGGTFGLQIGGYIGQDSMFHHVRNASKACYGQLLVRLRERGFEYLDVNAVAPHLAYYGAEWVPRWRFEQMLRESISHAPSLTDDRTPPMPAGPLLLRLKMDRLVQAVTTRCRSTGFQPVLSASGEKILNKHHFFLLDRQHGLEARAT